MKRRGHKTHETLDSISHCHRVCYLVCLLADCQGAGYFGCPSSIHNTVVTDEVPDDTQGIMEGSFCFFYDLGRRPCLSSSCWPRGTEPSLQPKAQGQNSYHLVSSSDENGHSSRVLTLLDNQHFVFCSAKRDLSHHTSKAQLLRGEL